jgi:hypothetical protein
VSFFHTDMGIPAAGLPSNPAAEDGVVTSTDGGVLRVSRPGSGAASHRNEPQAQWQPTKVHSGTFRVTADGQEAEHAGFARHVESFDGTRGGSVLATMQNSGAAGKTVELVPGIPGTRVQLAQALREGVLRETHPGVYEDVAGAPQALEQATQQQAQDSPQDPGADYFDQDDTEGWAAAIHDLPQPAYDAAVASVTLAAVTGRGLEDAAKSLASNARLSPELARDFVETGYAVYERAVAAAVEPLGLTGERKAQFYEWARNQPAQLQEAVQLLTHQRDLSGFVKLAGQFRHANPGDLSAWEKAGFETHVAHDGELLVRHGSGDWVSAKALGKA